MLSLFISPIPFQSHHHHYHQRDHYRCIPFFYPNTFSSTTPAIVTTAVADDLYETLKLPRTASFQQIRQAYYKLARLYHPDTATTITTTTTKPTEQTKDWMTISEAWRILSDEELRRVYDRGGKIAVEAWESMNSREQVKNIDIGEEWEIMEQQNNGSYLGLLESEIRPPDLFLDGKEKDEKDYCPKSIEEAIWNLKWHDDIGARYYACWWVYRFGVVQAEDVLVDILRKETGGNDDGNFRLRRRAALALGKIVGCRKDEREKNDGDNDSTDNHGALLKETTCLGLEMALRSKDYYLRYRVVEAIANIARRCWNVRFSKGIIDWLLDVLKKGAKRLEEKEERKFGYYSQESLFDLSNLDEEVRKKLEKIFHERRENEKKSRRTTMTPNLDVDPTVESDEPFEWTLKAVGAIGSILGNKSTDGLDILTESIEKDKLLNLVDVFTRHPIPLIKYAAHKAKYCLTGDEKHAMALVQALDYGVEHHYSQRVLIRDLGDIGFAQGAKAVADCPMVENSFKILALRNMLTMYKHNPQDPKVRMVLEHMDALL